MLKNSIKQGDLGVADAILYFIENGVEVSIPFSESCPYDILIDNGSSIDRVQVKTCNYKNPHGSYEVTLATKGGNKSGQSIKTIDCTKVDFIFILTGNKDRYLIPAKQIHGKKTVTVGNDYCEYKL